jgi:LPXTG-motif cell wall-anchored protein
VPHDPDVPDEPGVPGDPDVPGGPGVPGNPDEPGTPALPQTGQFWWPVPLLAAGGMMLFVLGYVMRRRENTHEEQ